MAIGYNKPLCVSPVDHWATFSKTLFGWEVPPRPQQAEKIAAAKQVGYDGFQVAIADGVRKVHARILGDKAFGSDLLQDAARQGFITACRDEKRRRDGFEFRYGPDFAHHIDEFNPTLRLACLDPSASQSADRHSEAR